MSNLKENSDIEHQVVVVGQEIFSSLTVAQLELERFNIEFLGVNNLSKLKRLNSYTLCVVSYEAFSSDNNYQPIFIKQMREAMEHGVSFCFVYYMEEALKKSGGHPLSTLSIRQVGSQVLSDFNIGKPSQTNSIIHEGRIKNKDFANYLKKWGSSKIQFIQLSENVELLYESIDNEVLGFSIPIKLGKIIFLPFIRNFSKVEDIKEGLKCLIDSLLTYIAKSHINLPVWAKESPFFDEEKTLSSEKNLLVEKLGRLENKLQKFEEAKSLLFHNEYNLEITLPNFLKNQLGLKIEQIETYKEDFWIIGEKGEKKAISEIKSRVKGFSKGLIHSILAHKEIYELDDDFPALLFVNCNLQSASWKDKDKSLNTEESKYAKNHNVLVIRVEDIVRLWEKKRLGEITSEEILNLFLTKKGWLNVTSDLKIEIKPK